MRSNVEETPKQAKAREDAAKAKAARDAARLDAAAKDREETAAKARAARDAGKQAKAANEEIVKAAAATVKKEVQKKPSSVAVPQTKYEQPRKEAPAPQPVQPKTKPVPAAVVTPPPNPQTVRTKPEMTKAEVVHNPVTKATEAVKQNKKVTAPKPVKRASQATVPAAEEMDHDYRGGPVLKTIELLSGTLKDKISAKQNEKGLFATLKRILGSQDEKDLKALKAIKDNIDRIGKLTTSDENKLKAYVEKHAPKPNHSR